MNFEKARIIHSARWTVFAKVVGQAMTFATTLLLVRLLAKADFGLFAMALLYIYVIDNVIDFGFLSAIIQAREVGRDELSGCFWILAATGLAVIGLSQLAAPAVAWIFSEERLAGIVRLLSAVFLAFPFTVISTGVLSRQYRLDVVASSELLAGILRCLLTISFAVAGMGVFSLIYGYLAERIVLGLILAYRSHWWPGNACSLKQIRPLFVFGLGVSGSRLLWMGFTKLDTLVIGRLLGAETLGIYSVASQIAMAFSQLISSACYRVVYPVFSKHQDSVHFNDLMTRASVYLAMVAMPVLFGIAATAPDIVTVFLGDGWRGAATPLRVLAIVAALQTLSGLVPQAINSKGRSDVSAWLNMGSLVVFGAAFYWGARLYGLNGLLAVWLVLFPCRYATVLLAAQAVIRLTVVDYLKRHLGLAVGTAAMVAAVLVAADHLAGWTAVHRLVFCISTGAIVYLLSLMMLVRRPLLEMMHIVNTR